jgi:hypothetical protein
MVCIPGWICEASTEDQYAKYKSTTGAATDNKCHRVDCDVCNTRLAAGSYQSHLEMQYNVF